MLNHARTLLMNIDCPSPQGMAYPGDELIAPGYKAKNLPTFIDVLRARLFGTAPDRYMLNYRCRQLLAMLHASPLEEYLLALDPRVTYDFSDRTLADPATFSPAVNRTSGASTDRLTVAGSPLAPDRSGGVAHSFAVDLLDSDTLRVSQLRPPSQKVLFEFEIGDGGVSARMPLRGSGYEFRVNTTNAGASWRVDVLNRPQLSLGELAASMESVGEPILLELFGVAREEPYLTFRNLWNDCRELPLRLGGLVTALIYRTEEAR